MERPNNPDINADEQKQEMDRQKDTQGKLQTLFDGGEVKEQKEGMDKAWGKHMQDPSIFQNLFSNLPKGADGEKMSKAEMMKALPDAMEKTMDKEIQTAMPKTEGEPGAQNEIMQLKEEMA